MEQYGAQSEVGLCCDAFGINEGSNVEAERKSDGVRELLLRHALLVEPDVRDEPCSVKSDEASTNTNLSSCRFSTGGMRVSTIWRVASRLVPHVLQSYRSSPTSSSGCRNSLRDSSSSLTSLMVRSNSEKFAGVAVTVWHDRHLIRSATSNVAH
jgi:hypothetical protein